MKDQKKKISLHVELGDFLESLRCSIPVDGKRLPIREVCRRASMSVSTYEHVKRAPV
jgi:hypothetical protein